MSTNTIQEVLEDLERVALDFCKKSGQPQNEDTEFDNRGMIESLLKGSNPPSKADCNKIAFDMLDWYTVQELTHTHNSKSEIQVKTINQVWARKGISNLTTKIEGAWQRLHAADEDREVVSSTKKSSTRKTGTLKDRVIAGGKKAVTKALVRKASRNLTDLSQTTIVGLLMSGVKSDDPGLRTQIAAVMGTDIGKALCAGFLSIAIQELPIPGLSEENKESLVEELYTEAFDKVTMPLENIVKMTIPMLTGALTPLLTGSSAPEEEPKQIPQTAESTV